jgi:hypothetical protein
MKEMIFLLTTADTIMDFPGEFYVIEKFHDPHFVTDENGEIKCFENYALALAEASECQQGFVITFQR